METKKADILARLLGAGAPNVQKELPEKRFEVKRLSQLLGEPVRSSPSGPCPTAGSRSCRSWTRMWRSTSCWPAAPTPTCGTRP